LTQPSLVQEQLVPSLLGALPGHSLALARQLPLFRKAVLSSVIERAARVNATHASATGVTEGVPRLGLPLTSEDVRTISANQAATAYRIGLVCGLPADWAADVTGLRMAVPVAQLWRKLGREVTGVVPLWGLGTKVALAFGGTALTCRSVQRWCEDGEPLPASTLHELSQEAISDARATSRDLVAKARDALPIRTVVRTPSRRLRWRLPRLRFPGRRARISCPSCGKLTAATSSLCEHCGQALRDNEKEKEG
jgi:hypothetical protein